MRNFITNKVKRFFAGIAGFLIAVPLLIAGGVYAATIYPAGSMLQPNDVTSSHIRDNTIVNADVNTAAAIVYSKLTAPGSDNNVTFNTAGVPSADAAFRWYTSGRTLMLAAGTIAATSTNFGGVAYTWPSADGTSNQALVTNSAGTLSWGNPSASQMTMSTTTRYKTTSGMAMGVAYGVYATSLTQTTGSTAATVLRTWGTVATQKVAQSFLGSDGTMAWQVSLLKTAAPADSIALAIQADSAGSPSGTDLVNTSIVGSTLTGSCVLYTFTMPTNVTLTAGSTYWAVLSRSGANDNTNYYSVCGDSTNAYANGGESWYNGSAWSADANADFTFKTFVSAVPGQLFPANATSATSSQGFIGFAQAVYATSTTATMTIGGVDTMQSGLTVGAPIYLSNTDGSIGSTAGTVTKKVCIAIEGTKCLITNIW